MEGTWNNERVNYRCKITPAVGHLAAAGHPATVYVREDKILEQVDPWLDGLFTPRRRRHTVDALYRGSEDPAADVRRSAARAALQDCDQRLARYRAALEAGADPRTVTGWISEVTVEKTRHEMILARYTGARMTREQVAALVDQLAGIAAVLREADPQDRAELYRQLGLRLTYQREGRLIVAETEQPCTNSCVRGGT